MLFFTPVWWGVRSPFWKASHPSDCPQVIGLTLPCHKWPWCQTQGGLQALCSWQAILLLSFASKWTHKPAGLWGTVQFVIGTKGDSHFKWKLYTCCCATQSWRWARAQAHSCFRRAKTPLQKARFQRASKLEPRRPISSLYLQSDSTFIWPSEVSKGKLVPSLMLILLLFFLLLLSSWLLLVIVSCWWLLFVGSDWFRTYFLHAQTCDYVW